MYAARSFRNRVQQRAIQDATALDIFVWQQANVAPPGWGFGQALMVPQGIKDMLRVRAQIPIAADMNVAPAPQSDDPSRALAVNIEATDVDDAFVNE